MAKTTIQTVGRRKRAVARVILKPGKGEWWVNSRSLEEIGTLMGITRERVRQIKQKGLIRLRHASRARFLETFF